MTHSLLLFNSYGAVPSPQALLAHCCRGKEAQDWSPRLLQGMVTPSPAALQDGDSGHHSSSSWGMASPRSPARRLLAASTAMVLLVAYVALPMCGRITAGGQRRLLACSLPLLTSYSLFQGSSWDVGNLGPPGTSCSSTRSWQQTWNKKQMANWAFLSHPGQRQSAKRGSSYYPCGRQQRSEIYTLLCGCHVALGGSAH